jgi:hypothetical protein
MASKRDIAAIAKALKSQPTPHAFDSKWFCQHWPGIKKSLQELDAAVAKIPGYGFLASIAIEGLIAIGDGISAAFCE